MGNNSTRSSGTHAASHLFIRNGARELQYLILRRNVQTLALKLSYLTLVKPRLANGGLPTGKFIFCLLLAAFHFVQVGEVRQNKPQIKDGKYHRGHAYDDALFKRPQVFPITFHSTSTRLSSKLKFHFTLPPARS